MYKHKVNVVCQVLWSRSASADKTIYALPLKGTATNPSHSAVW